MKKIIATIIRAIMPKAVKEHEKEEKARRNHNAVIIQSLLDNEHMIKDSVNNRFDTVYTTKKALKTARVYRISDYRSDIALENADFKLYVVLMNDKDNGPDVPFTTYPYLHLYATTTNKVNGESTNKTIAATSNPTSLTLT